MSSFKDLQLNKQLLQAIETLGYDRPTPVQEQAVPKIMAGHDVIGIAQTGTGKTAAFLLPILMKIKFAQGDQPRVLILEPTRELAIQIEKECEKFCAYTDIRYLAVYGGIGSKTQREKIESGIDILIATPGRLMDLYKEWVVSFKDLQYFIIDEADRMMQMGFLPQIHSLLEIVPRKRQNLLFSATMPDQVKKLTEDFLEFPVEIAVTPQSTPATTVTQKAYHVENGRTKINLLEHLLLNDELSKVIVFTRSKKTADGIFKYLERKSDGVMRVIHSNKGQNSRINAINQFKSGEVRVLVSTDVTARGIDVENVSHVINFDVPIQYEDYVHRIGRTGRAFSTGTAISLVNEAEQFHIKKIEELIQMDIEVEAFPEAVEVTPTPREEAIQIAKQVDHQKRRDDPEFKGAFQQKTRDKNKKQRFVGDTSAKGSGKETKGPKNANDKSKASRSSSSGFSKGKKRRK